MRQAQKGGVFVRVGFVPDIVGVLQSGGGAISRVQSTDQPYCYLTSPQEGDDPILLASPANTVRSNDEDGVFLRRIGVAPLLVDAGGHIARLRLLTMSNFGQPKGDAAVSIATVQNATSIAFALGQLAGSPATFSAAPARFQAISSTVDPTLGQIDLSITFSTAGEKVITLQYGCDYATLHIILA